MNIFKYLGAAGLVAAVVLSGSLAQADPKPANSKRADSQTVANFYAGSSRIWKSCNGGGVYLGGGWEAQAYCNKNSESVGLGTWSVKKGVMCSDLVWYWKSDGVVKSKKNDSPDCIAHIVDAEGQIWRRWNDDKDWWRLPQSVKADKSGAKGFKFKSKVNRTKRKLGL